MGQDGEEDEDDDEIFDVRVESASGSEGLWYQGPTKVVRIHDNRVMWDFAERVSGS